MTEEVHVKCRKRADWRLAVAAMLLMPLGAAQAGSGWAFQDKWVDVTEDGRAHEAVELAHNLLRLDAAIVKMFRMDLGDSRPPVHIYAMPESQLQKLLGDQKIGSEFQIFGYESVVLINTDAAEENRYYGAYDGYSASVLTSEGALRYPFWFRSGLAEIFSAASMDHKGVKIGDYLPWHARTLLSGTPLPMRTLLRMHQNDPQVQLGSPVREMFDSECWFLAHLFIIEGKLRPQFGQYLELMSRGQAEADAFAASFPGMSYEDLDKMLRDALHVGKVQQVVVQVPEEPDSRKPEPLSAAELKGRLARIGVLQSKSLDYPLKLAHEALAAEPTNESALRALALGQLHQKQYADSYRTMQALRARGSLSAPAYADCAQIGLSVAQAVKQGDASVGEDAPALMRQARQDYEQAIALDQENLGYWSKLVALIGQEQDAEAVRTLRLRVERLFYLHPRNAELARSLSGMYSQTGDFNNALKFAVAWQGNAMNEESRDAAAAYISRMKTALERRNAVSGAAEPARSSTD